MSTEHAATDPAPVAEAPPSGAEPGSAPGEPSPDAGHEPSGGEEPRLLDVEGAPPGAFGELEPAAPPMIDRQGRVRLSFSRIDSHENCPRKFRYAYVDRLPGEPSPHLSFGTSVHGALEAFYDRKLPECPTLDELLGFLYDAWDSSGFNDRSRDEQLAFYRHAQDVLRRYHERCAPTYRLPAATEAWFELPVGHEAVVVGSIDRVDVDDDGRLHVIDYKTNRKAKPRHRVAGSLQLAIYALACRHLYGQLPATVSLDFVVPGLPVVVDIEELDLDDARSRILEAAAEIRAHLAVATDDDRLDPRAAERVGEAGAFPPRPNPLCDWCDFKAICPAWPSDADAEQQSLGTAVAELRSLRRRAARDVRALRELEAGVERLSAELADAGPEPPPAAAPADDGRAGQ